VPGAFAAHPILRIRSPIIGRGEQVFELTGAPVTIGRAEDCDVVLLEQSASRVHARLLPEAGGWILVDEESHAGVFVGGQRVRRHVLADGDRFRIGETDFQLVARPASQPTLVGATRPPTGETPIAIPSIASAPTIASGLFGDEELRRVPAPASLSVPPTEEAAAIPAAPPRPMAPPPRPAPPRRNAPRHRAPRHRPRPRRPSSTSAPWVDPAPSQRTATRSRAGSPTIHRAWAPSSRA
jgi:pSer/pThr/pTyr-binding forkhead associated (FHA) protein